MIKREPELLTVIRCPATLKGDHLCKASSSPKLQRRAEKSLISSAETPEYRAPPYGPRAQQRCLPAHALARVQVPAPASQTRPRARAFRFLQSFKPEGAGTTGLRNFSE